jgi:hypothetical protein
LEPTLLGTETVDVNDQTPEGSSSKKVRDRVAQALDCLGVGMDVTTLLGPVLNAESPMIFVITGFLGLGLHSAARKVRKR